MYVNIAPPYPLCVPENWPVAFRGDRSKKLVPEFTAIWHAAGKLFTTQSPTGSTAVVGGWIAAGIPLNVMVKAVLVQVVPVPWMNSQTIEPSFT